MAHIISEDGVVTRKEFEFMTPMVIVGCGPQGLKKIPVAAED